MKPKLIRITTIPLSLDKLLTNQMQFMNQFFEVTAVSSDLPYLQKIAKQQQVKYKCIEMSRKITPLKDCISLFKMILFFIKQKPLIVHTHTPKAGIIGMLAAKIAGVPNRYHTVAGLPLMEATGIKRKVLNFVEKLTYSCATKVYPNSMGLYDFILKEEFTKANKLKVLGNGSSNGIDTSYFDASLIAEQTKSDLKNALGILDSDFVFVFVGRLVSDKGINELVQAFNQVTITHKNAKLLLVGPLEDDLDPLLPETTLSITSNPNIISVGYQADVRPYLAISHLLTFPSYREGFPNVVMQAGAMGIPAIVSDINGCNEIVRNNVNGIIIPVKQIQPLFNEMLNVLCNIQFYNDLVSNSRISIVQRFEQKYIWNEIVKEYQKSKNYV